MKAWLALWLVVCAGGAALAAEWADDGPVAVKAALDGLNRDLLSHDSATAVLQDWCDAHGPGGLRITAERVRGEDRPPISEATAALHAQTGQAVRYRRVRLACGATILSEADNWYLPDRLTPEMNQLLDSGDTPFGVAVRALAFRRRHLTSQTLYDPSKAGAGPAPRDVLRQTGVLSTPDGTPFSFVVETYTSAVLQPPRPR